MRTLLLCSLSMLLAGPAEAAERTWTIAREVYTAEAELVAVRGDLAYLKIDGRVEEIPIGRLSAIDQQYIASLSLAPVAPGPAVEHSVLSVSPAVATEEMPLPGPPDSPADSDLELNAPELAPAYGGTPIRPPESSQAQYRVDRYGHTIAPQPGTPANYLAPLGGPRGPVAPNAAANPNERRYRRPPQGQGQRQQGPSNQADRSQRDKDDADDGPGILGFRGRRLERERAAANRSR